MTHPYFTGARHPRVLAHRGLTAQGGDSAADGAWENTAAAFAAAHAAGAEYIESDCQVTSDGEVVLFHDATLERLLGDPRSVAEVRTRELAGLLAAHGGLLTVAEALDAFPQMRFNIDVKADAAAEPIGTVVAPHAHRVLLTSFSDARRREAIASAMAAGASIRPAASGGQATIARVRALTAIGLSPARVLREVDALQIPKRFGIVPVFSPGLVRAAHRAGVEVHVWTVNDPAEMRALVAAGADGIVTDRADAALTALATP